MAAQGGVRDKILRVSMPFEKGRNSIRKLRMVLPKKRLLFGNTADPWRVVLKVRSWHENLKKGGVRSCAEIARREGITPALVSQLWPLLEITREQAEKALTPGNGRKISLRALIRVARKTQVNLADSGGGNPACG